MLSKLEEFPNNFNWSSCTDGRKWTFMHKQIVFHCPGNLQIRVIGTFSYHAEFYLGNQVSVE